MVMMAHELISAHRPRQTEREHLLTVKARVFGDSDASAYSIVPSMRDAASISSRTTRTTVTSELGEDIRYIPFDFEDSLFTSWVYKRNFRPQPAEPSSSALTRFPLGRRTPQSPCNIATQAADAHSIAHSSSADGSSDAVSSIISSGSAISHGSSVQARRSSASPITLAESSGRNSFSSATASPTPDAADKLAKLFEVMVS